LKKLNLVGVMGMCALLGCASINPNDERAKDFSEKQLAQVTQLIDDYAKAKSCSGYKLLERKEGSYPSDTSRRLQFWEVDICGTKARIIAMTRKVPKDGWEVCINDKRPCAIAPSSLNGLKPGEE
jgi:hypothetical protein